MTLVAGADCSTQSTKVVVCDAATGVVVRQGQAPHPDATEVDPQRWWRAWLDASADLLADVAAIAVAGQQHGMITMDERNRIIRPALLWNDTRSARAATDLTAELGGPAAWAAAVGSVPVASLTVTKLRWLAEHEPAAARRVARVLLPHDWLTWRLAGMSGEPTTDRGDASGTGYWSAAQERYRPDLLRMALGAEAQPPTVAYPAEVVAHTPDGRALAAGTGDNMAAALGLGARPGDVVVSLGTSGTVFAVADHASADATGMVSGFADATGRHLPLVCTLNAARVLTATAEMLNVDTAALDALARQSSAGAGGLTMLPYLDGERVPNLPAATGQICGLTRSNATAANLARAAVEGMLFGLADGIDAIARLDVPVHRVLLIGGAARAAAVREVAAELFAVPVEIPEPAEYVALGAARQAAWALSAEADPPRWPVAVSPTAAGDGERYRQARTAYESFRDRMVAAES